MVFKSLFGKKGRTASGVSVGGGKELLHLSKTVHVPVETAFQTFVDELHTWWPAEYTWGKDKLKDVGIEPKMGGTCFEESDGNRQTWGTVLAFHRPVHVVFAWQITPDRKFEPNEAMASRVDVRFSPNQHDEGATDVLVVHRDFFRHGEGWEAYRQEMASEKGWPHLITRFAEAAESKAK